MTDFLLHEKFYKIIKEIPKPRLLFRKGVTVRGFFRPYMPFGEYTEASIFSDIDTITPVTVRFSSMFGDKGTADTLRNIKGMNIKFHVTDDMKYDMLCSSMPVFFINEASKLEKLMDAFTVNEVFDGINGEKFWDFVISNPEAANCALRLFSHQGLTDSFVNKTWFANNTYIWKNNNNDRFLVRCRWYPVIEKSEGNEEQIYLDRNTAEFMAGIDPYRAINNIKAMIKNGEFPSFEFQIQMMEYMEPVEIDNTKCTLTWDESIYPYIPAGVMKLVSISENNSNDCDKISFAPSSTIKGIEIYEDELSEMFDWIYKIEAAERGVMI